MSTAFDRLNVGWNAEPNAPDPRVTRDGRIVRLEFFLNSFLYPQFDEEDRGVLQFDGCWRFRLGPTNDEGWFAGKCRFSGLAPSWGEFYEVTGDLLADNVLNDWVLLSSSSSTLRHFLFYLRDQTFEVDAKEWSFTVVRSDKSLS